jgi:hypothetical protein
VWVAAGNGYIQTSIDTGNTWSSYLSSDISCITYSRETGTFVAISKTFTNGTYISTDGLNWTQYRNLPTNVNSASTSIAHGNGLYVAVLNGDSNVFYSRDGQFWSIVNVPSGVHTWNSIAYGNGKFISVASDGTLMVSYNATDWSIISGGTVVGPIYYASGIWVSFSGVSYAGYIPAYSTDGTTFYNTNTPLPYNFISVYDFGLPRISYGNGYFMFLVNVISSSTSGVRKSLSDLNYTAAYSQDGINWSTLLTPPTTSWSGLAFGQNTFMGINTTGGTTTITQVNKIF